ncbi:hypothetical protein FKM82_024768 [Ascaphus truei]
MSSYIWCQKWDERWPLKLKGALEMACEIFLCFLPTCSLANSLSNKNKDSPATETRIKGLHCTEQSHKTTDGLFSPIPRGERERLC